MAINQKFKKGNFNRFKNDRDGRRETGGKPTLLRILRASLHAQIVEVSMIKLSARSPWWISKIGPAIIVGRRATYPVSALRKGPSR